MTSQSVSAPATSGTKAAAQREIEPLVRELSGLQLHMSEATNTGYFGVPNIQSKNKFWGGAAISIGKQLKTLGAFDTATEATIAFAHAKREQVRASLA